MGSAPLRLDAKSFRAATSPLPSAAWPRYRGLSDLASRTWNRTVFPSRWISSWTRSPAAGKVDRGGLGACLRLLRHHSPHHHHLHLHLLLLHHHRIVRRLLDRPIDVGAVRLDQANERGVGLVEILESDRQSDGRAIFLCRLGKLADRKRSP